ncbi:MAG: hypothetical protein V1738_06850 [Patescibacteria group bacterium]
MDSIANQINFPAEEYAGLQQQFDHFGFAYTIRVSDELDQYHVGQVLETPWGRRVRVSEAHRINSISDYPYLDELTDAQINFLSDFKLLEYLKLDYV